MDRPALEEVLDRHRRRLLALPGVHGVAAGTSREDAGQVCVIVYAEAGERPAGLPERLEGYAVELRGSAGFRAR